MSCSSSVLAPELLMGMLALLSAPLTHVLFTQSLCDFAHAWRQSKGSSPSRQLVNLVCWQTSCCNRISKHFCADKCVGLFPR